MQYRELFKRSLVISVNFALVTLFLGCSSMRQYAPISGSPDITNLTPFTVEDYLKNNVDPATLKKWDSALSNDQVLIERYDQQGNKIETIIGR